MYDLSSPDFIIIIFRSTVEMAARLLMDISCLSLCEKCYHAFQFVVVRVDISDFCSVVLEVCSASGVFRVFLSCRLSKIQLCMR